MVFVIVFVYDLTIPTCDYNADTDLSGIYHGFSDIKAYFENTYDIDESLFTSLSGKTWLFWKYIPGSYIAFQLGLYFVSVPSRCFSIS